MLDQIAAETDGLSGADLQAMLYNAHLEVVQSSIAAWDVEKGIDRDVVEKAKGKGKGKSKGKGKAVENGAPVSDPPTVGSVFRQLAPVEELSRQERATMESRVSRAGLPADSCLIAFRSGLLSATRSRVPTKHQSPVGKRQK